MREPTVSDKEGFVTEKNSRPTRLHREIRASNVWGRISRVCRRDLPDFSDLDEKEQPSRDLDTRMVAGERCRAVCDSSSHKSSEQNDGIVLKPCVK